MSENYEAKLIRIGQEIDTKLEKLRTKLFDEAVVMIEKDILQVNFALDAIIKELEKK